MFAYENRARLAYVMTLRQIVSCKLDPHIRTTRVDVVSENCVRVNGRKLWRMLVTLDSRKQKSYGLNRP